MTIRELRAALREEKKKRKEERDAQETAISQKEKKLNELEMEFRYRTSQHNQSYISPNCNCYIRNEKTENSTVTLSSPSAWRKWIRVITNSVTLHGRSMDDYTPMPGDPQFNDPSEAHPSGIVELYGYQNVTLKGKFFFGLTGARYGNGPRDFLPAFVAVGANIQTDGIARFHNSLNVLTGTVFDTLRNNTYPCTVAVKQ